MKKHDHKDLILSDLKEASMSLAKFMKNNRTEEEQVLIVRAFKFCYELSWKAMKKFLYNEGIEINVPRKAFIESAKFGIIKDKNAWFDFSKREIR